MRGRQARALILARVGDADGALEEIERLLAAPAYGFSVTLLQLDPRWDPIRSDPRFQELLKGYDRSQPAQSWRWPCQSPGARAFSHSA